MIYIKANNKRPQRTKMTKTKMSKYEIYKIIYNDRNVYIEWLDEIKKNGVDNKKRVRNPLREGSLIYTDKDGLYIFYTMEFMRSNFAREL